MGLLDDLEDLLDPIFDGVRGLFGGGDDNAGDEDLSPQERVDQILNGGSPGPFGPGPGAGPGVPVPGGPSGLQVGADQAGTTYQQAAGAAGNTDDKLAGLLKQIFASNDATRSRISDIINGLESAHRQLVSNPQLANDPGAIAWFNKLLDNQLGQVQQLLESAKVDSQKQAELLAALGDEYRNNTGDHSDDHKKDGKNGKDSKDGKDGADGGTSGDGGSGGSGDGGGGGGGADPAPTPAGAATGVTDPLAGLGGPLGGGMGDPLSMLGPALAGLGSIPGQLGGAASSLPMDALGSLAPLAGELAGQGSGDGTNDHGKPADSVDDSHGKSDGDGGKTSDGNAGKDDTGGKKPDPSTPGTSPPAQQPTPAAAVPASAGGDPGRVVQMPDGSPVTAPSAQHATAMRAVLNGATVTDGWKQANVQLAPPGTPVTAPADPAHLVPGEVAQFKSRDPVMYMGNGKIWLDGQLQPQSALPTGDFLGWQDPTQQAGATAPVPGAPAPTPAASPTLPTTTTNTSGS